MPKLLAWLIATGLGLIPAPSPGQSSAPLVLLPQGSLQGTLLTTSTGRQISAFRRIPYAKPPIGRLRFANPELADPWVGTLNASEDLPMCLQFNLIIPGQNNTVGQEDCLYLNVFTPSLSEDANLPVVVYFHGGAWYFGTGANHGPDYLLNEDIVLVEVNYRIGPLGFLSLEEGAAWGNWGLKDQALALKWVHTNIHAFGGSSFRITIMGESAGGASAHFHMFSPLSSGLIAGVISMSGTALNPWSVATRGLARSRAIILANTLKCSCHDSIIPCLRTKSAMEIVDASRQFFIWEMDPLVAFMPVIEHPSSEGAFLTVDPFKTTPPPIPWITGISSGEGLIRTARFTLTGEEDYRRINTEFNELMPVTLLYFDTAKDPDRVSRAIRQVYFNNQNISDALLPDFTDLVTDALFLSPVLDSLSLHPGPSYLYYFDYVGRLTFADLLGSRRISNQAAHTDETIYLFNLGLGGPLGGRDLEVSNILVHIVAEFATYNSPPAELFWEMWGLRGAYIRIGEPRTSTQSNLLAARYLRWKSLNVRDKFE